MLPPLLFKTKPKVERVLVSDPYFNEIAKFRYKTYCEELNFLDKNKYPDKEETDGYDDNSIHIVVRIGKRLGGYARVIFPREGTLPIFEHFDVLKEKDMEHACEISRFMISKVFRNNHETRRGVFGLLVEEILEAAKENHIKVTYAAVEEWLLKSLVKRKYNFQEIGDGKHHMGAVTYPTKLKIV